MKKQIDAKSYIFLDESGKPETFSRKGTNLVQAGTASKYLVISAVRTNHHLAVQQAVTEFRLKLLKDESTRKPTIRWLENYFLNGSRIAH